MHHVESHLRHVAGDHDEAAGAAVALHGPPQALLRLAAQAVHLV
jgi:hypothetical protein